MRFGGLLTLIFVCSVDTQNIGKFWHISDHHLDPYYNAEGQNPIDVCPSSYGRESANPGPLGDYNCDSPWELIKSSVHAMKRLHANPDFIIWTGDDTLHTSDQDKYLGPEKVLEIIGNITAVITEVFPDSRVFPAMGNHDYHPKNQIPPGGSVIVSALAGMWEHWLTKDAYITFRQEGYYKDTVPGSENHIMMVLNSNYWYNSNKAVDGTGDPGLQFRWMKLSLESARVNNQKVFIVGHISPGYFELVSNFRMLWYYSEFNNRFISIVREFDDVIAGMFFGHHHTDTFKIVKDTKGNVISSMLLAPGVTPWATTLPGVVDGANNPGIRLVEYDKDTMMLTDYVQYYLNLDEANQQSEVDPASLWKEEYRATQKYGIPDVTTTSLNSIAKAMREGCESKDSVCPTSFNNYHVLNTVSYNKDPCDENCQKYHLCAIMEVEENGYNSCMDNWGSDAIRPTAHLSGIFMGLIVYANIV